MKRFRVWLALGALCAFASLQGAHAADMNKTVRVAFSIAETSFDCAFASDEVSQSVTERVFDSMLEYDYLAKPLKLVTRVLTAMPEITDGGKTLTAKVQSGIFFQDDPAFGGKPRELVAADFAYSLKRIIDPKVKSPWWFLLEGKVVGANDARETAQRVGAFNYDTPLAGLEVVDKYTLRIRLVNPDFNFLWILAMPSTSAMAREVVEKYGIEIGSKPIGTGPYRLGEYKRSSKTTLVASSTYRQRTWDWKSERTEDQALIAAMKGKPVPAVGKVEIYVVEEGQARWLAFLNGEHDYLADLPVDVINLAKTGTALKPDIVARGITMSQKEQPGLYYDLFNMEHPVFGGYSKERIALRRAISMAFPLDEQINIIWNGDGEALNGVIPPALQGFDPTRPRSHVYDLEIAKKLLDRYGYTDRDGDGWRDQPNGSPLIIERITGTSTVARQNDELWKKAMNTIGIKISFSPQKVPDRRKAAREGKATFMTEAWIADYPDAENFLQLLYGKNSAAENYARFRSKEFDDRYDQIRLMTPGQERNRLINEMQDIVQFTAPWIAPRREIAYTLQQPWILGYRKHMIAHDGWEYIDIDLAKRGTFKKQ